MIAVLISDYRPQYWYYEIVTYSRKLILGGVAVVMGRGTMRLSRAFAALNLIQVVFEWSTDI